jgi:hypothetical protein
MSAKDVFTAIFSQLPIETAFLLLTDASAAIPSAYGSKSSLFYLFPCGEHQYLTHAPM